VSVAKTPEPPYYAVIFTSIRKADSNEYNAISKRMVELVQKQSGFLGFESAREEIGITISYWDSLEAIQQWKQNFEHQVAQNAGKEKFYQSYKVRISKVERDYDFKLA